MGLLQEPFGGLANCRLDVVQDLGNPMYRLFLSYRREDSEDFAGRIADYLEHRFGEQSGGG